MQPQILREPFASWREAPTEGELRLVPLGGFGEFGMNCLAVHTTRTLLLVDCGQLFPGEEQPGVDSIVPDFAYLEPFADQLDAVLLTHGHEDHIGALPYLLGRWPVPVYGTAFTLGLLEPKLREHDIVLPPGHLRRVRDGETHPIGWGEFQAEFIPVAHSIPQACAIALHTPRGIVVHTGDYKLDTDPVDGRRTDLARFRELGDAGVLIAFGDSTNVAREGPTPSEARVKAGLRAAFERTPGRLFVSPFSSNVHRIQTLLDLAAEYGRAVGLLGRSLERCVGKAVELGLLDLRGRPLLGPEELEALAPDRVLVILSGTQGESQSALGRLVRGEIRKLSIGPGDRIVMSSRAIPGNEATIRRRLDQAARLGAETLLGDPDLLHATGHGHRDDVAAVLTALRPRYVAPAHGTYQNLREQGRLAEFLGWPREDIFLLDPGDCLQVRDGEVRLAGTVPAGKCFVDQGASDRMDARVIHDRLILQEDGIVVATFLVDPDTGQLVSDPAILTRGFVFPSDDPAYEELLRSSARRAYEDAPREVRSDRDLLVELLRQALRRIIRKTTQNRPLVVPLLLNVSEP